MTVRMKLFNNFVLGFSRLSLPWFAPDDVIDYILDCIIFVAEQGWKFMVHYDINPDTGEWSHFSKLNISNSFSLDKISYSKGYFDYQPRRVVAIDPANSAHPVNLRDYLTAAKKELAELTSSISELYVPDLTDLFQGEAALLRWVILPCEAKDLLVNEVEKKIRRKRPPLT